MCPLRADFAGYARWGTMCRRAGVASHADGNTLTDTGGRTMTWDSQNRMTSCTYQGTTSTFTYGADGLRRSSTRGLFRERVCAAFCWLFAPSRRDLCRGPFYSKRSMSSAYSLFLGLLFSSDYSFLLSHSLSLGFHRFPLGPHAFPHHSDPLEPICLSASSISLWAV